MQSYLWMVLSGEMDKMSEERVTKEILKYLKKNGWYIFSYDFPQSGTGTLISSDDYDNEKNKDSIIPDIIAIKNNICVFFENKDRIVISDFDKVNSLRVNNKYLKNLNKLLMNYNIKQYFYGIGLPKNIKIHRLNNIISKSDFILLVDENYNIIIYDDKNKIFI